ncbi:hypothetical protein JW868_03265, partial [Candidatus Woesearchaeota archaeon]|nr:hypothetical protein [Candidatus Woesearchaeota archaeon]
YICLSSETVIMRNQRFILVFTAFLLVIGYFFGSTVLTGHVVFSTSSKCGPNGCLTLCNYKGDCAVSEVCCENPGGDNVCAHESRCEEVIDPLYLYYEGKEINVDQPKSIDSFYYDMMLYSFILMIGLVLAILHFLGHQYKTFKKTA